MKIDKHIPIPQKPKAKPKYPFLDMNVGESIFFDGQGVGGTAYFAAMSVGRRHNRVFCGRSEGSGVRIWRIA